MLLNLLRNIYVDIDILERWIKILVQRERKTIFEAAIISQALSLHSNPMQVTAIMMKSMFIYIMYLIDLWPLLTYEQIGL